MKTGPDKIFTSGPGKVFVFGSNTAGIHGAGAAKTAFEMYGAKWGQGEGLYGSSYALPTKDMNLKTLPIHAIEKHIQTFLDFSWNNQELTFFVTKIGCGLAGYTEEEIAPMFQEAPVNCVLPHGWRGEQIEESTACS